MRTHHERLVVATMMVALCAFSSVVSCAKTSSSPSSSSASLARRQGQGEDVLLETAVLSTNAFPSMATRSGEVEEEGEENDAWLTDVVVEVFSDDDERDDDDDDVEVTVRGFETVDFYDVSFVEESKGSEENEEEREEEEEEEEEEEDEKFAADDVDHDDEEDDDFHPTYWEITGEIEDQDFIVEYPPLPLLRGKDADEIEMWASFPTMFWSKETRVTYVVPNDVRSHIDSIVQRVILKTLYLGLTMFVLVVFVLDTCCGCVFNDTSPDEFEHNFDGDEERGHWERLHDRFEQPLYFDTAYKTFREFPAPTKAKPASTQTSCVV